jgi:adenine-specific DNA-methyltransferase
VANRRSNNKAKSPREASTYRHPEAESLLRPEVGTQAQFKKRKPPVTYRYDSSLSPALDWDGQNHAREAGEALIREILEAESLESAKSAADRLKAMSAPFLNWAGKAERLSFDVPTLPLFVHERLSTKGIIETLKGHKLDKQMEFSLFGDPNRSITDQVLKAYEYRDKWVNRMILGDSLVVMNSLLHYEGLGGQVQMIYIDPPYGVNFGSNFQPFVRKRDVSHNDDEDMTREPEMVKAYRDTWELGLHSYLTYLRDRLLLARELLSSSGSVFVQISDENLHLVREVMDEIFGSTNFGAVISVRKTTGAGSPSIGTNTLPITVDYLLWYTKDIEQVRYRQLYLERGGEGWVNYDYVRLPDGNHRRMTIEERADWRSLPQGAAVYRRDNLTSTSSVGEASQPFDFRGTLYSPGVGGWKTSKDGLKRLEGADRLEAYGRTLSYRRFATDFPWFRLTDLWDDTITGGYAEQRFYVVQTNSKIVQRCILMTTEPGDLVLDPTCGSGTTAYVAEQWGRRWITIDTSRVPLALARQRLLTATFPYYQLKDEARGPAGGFDYKRKQNNKGEEVGGIVPHITLKSIANDEPPDQEVLVDRPEVTNSITRVSGPFCVEATIPMPVDYDLNSAAEGGVADDHGSFVDRMLEVLRKSPVLQVGANKKVTLKNVRTPAKTLSLSAEAQLANGNGNGKNVAFVFGPENGAVSEKLVHDAAFEAHGKGYSHLYVVGFAIQPNARNLIDNCDAVMSIPATYVQATPDLMMGDLLKTMRSSQIFSVCGLPEVKLRKLKGGNGATQYQAELIGLDVFDPVEMKSDSRPGDDVPAWFLDTDYNGLCFHVSQAFFPRTSAWENLKKALRGTYDETVWDHLAGTTSAPFEVGEHGQIAVKVIDDRGNELMVVKDLKDLKE